jgi:hypothetical protein
VNFIRALIPNCPTARIAAALATAVGALFLGGCSTTLSSGRSLETIVALAPAPVLVQKGQELRAADEAASHTTGAQAFIGAGDSMQPVYASGTAIVVTPCDFAQLRPGMSVVYLNAEGRGIAHSLVESTRDGWVVQGVNNSEPDSDLVTAKNLVGVITQAYASSDTAVRREIAARNALKVANAMGNKAQVAANLSEPGTEKSVSVWQ